MKRESEQQFVAALRKYVPIVKDAQSRRVSEAITKLHLSQFLTEVLGYDLFTDVIPEHGIKARYADFAIRIREDIKFLIEVKQVSLSLKQRHLFQLTNYAASEGIEWCLLTNSASFELYHVEFKKPVSWKFVFSTNLIDEDLLDTVEKLSYLTKRSMQRDEIEEYWRKIEFLNPTSIAEAILSDDSIKVIRRMLRKKMNLLVSEKELAAVIRSEVIRERISKALEEIEREGRSEESVKSRVKKTESKGLIVEQESGSAVESGSSRVDWKRVFEELPHRFNVADLERSSGKSNRPYLHIIIQKFLKEGLICRVARGI
ncbi:MAG: type I restriction enzyme HsdR N-terminal domain-containing protein [Nitrospinota bacterium]